MMKLRYITLLIGCALLLNACSSKEKKADGGQGAAAEVADIEGDDQPATGRPNEMTEIPTSKSGSVDAKYKGLANAIRNRQGNVQDEATKILGTNSNDPVALNALALIHLRRGRTGAARLLLGRALEKNPPTAALLNNLGVALMQDGELEPALANFKKALQTDDKHTEALGNLGSIYAQAGDFDKARPLLEQSYKQNRANSQVASNYALALRASKDFEGARRVYEEVLKSNSKDVNTILNYAILLIDYMSKPKDGLDLVYKVKLLETERKDVLTRANALEKKARSELK